MKRPETSQLHFFGRKCHTCSRSLFCTAAHFNLALVAAIISHVVTLFFQQKNVSFVFFISRSRSLSPFFSLSFAGLPPIFSFSLALYYKFVGMTSLIFCILCLSIQIKYFFFLDTQGTEIKSEKKYIRKFQLRPAPLRADPRLLSPGISIFWALDGKFLGVGTLELKK